MSLRAEWKYAFRDSGGQYVMTSGIPEMQVLPADSLVSSQNVRGLLNTIATFLALCCCCQQVPLTLINPMSELDLLSLTRPSYYSRRGLVHENHFMGVNNVQSYGAVPQNHGHCHYQGYRLQFFLLFPFCVHYNNFCWSIC